ncbi:MAG TPA: sigma-70 family RNA polymerase sigma factor [Polyangiaceae bacterium]|jgi:RNA polymerase sigma-70 factor (ECF subfamily)
MDASARAELERDVRALSDGGDQAGAATLALKGYGPEIFGFLIAVHGNEADASDIFSELAEALWRGLPGFAWESTLRTWAYSVARNIMRRRRRDAGRRQRRGPRAGDSALEGIAQAVRTETLSYLRTEKKTRLQALRDALPEEDRMLLVLRLDRQLSWNELARVLAEGAEGDGDASMDDAALARESARLRKRFQLVKDRLRDLAKKEGLIE